MSGGREGWGREIFGQNRSKAGELSTRTLPADGLTQTKKRKNPDKKKSPINTPPGGGWCGKGGTNAGKKALDRHQSELPGENGPWDEGARWVRSVFKGRASPLT